MTEYHGHKTMKDGSHVPLTKDEAAEIMEAVEKSEADSAERMPNVWDALSVVCDAKQRMRRLGWWPGGGFGLRAGDECAVVELGSTGMWSGSLDDKRELVYYCDCVSKVRNVWLKPLDKLTDEERAHMEYCDKDQAEYMEAQFARWSQFSEPRTPSNPKEDV